MEEPQEAVDVDAVAHFLAGNSKEDELLIDQEEHEGIEFKRGDNVLVLDVFNCDEEINNGNNEESNGKRRFRTLDLKRHRANALKKRSIRCLNKMHVMEDVREGCDVQGAQPSSPGHAEQGALSKDQDIKEEPKDVNDSDDSKTLDAKSNEGKPNGTGEHTNDVEDKDDGTEDGASNDSSDAYLKRKMEGDESQANKKMRSELEQNYTIRDKILNDYIDATGCTESVEQIQTQMDIIANEIKTLTSWAKEKEKEWNNIIHLKKIKEELLLRIQRRKEVLLIEERKGDKKKVMVEINGDVKQQQRQRPTLDVQSIIADYRQRHPEAVPRRGRRIRSLAGGGAGSGAQVKQNSLAADNGTSNSELGLLLTAVDSNSKKQEAQQLEATSFKDVLMQFAKLSQHERQDVLQTALKPPSYTEVTVHPVPAHTQSTSTNSLLHGILTKTQTRPDNGKSTFSPTLARLLTAPEKAAVNSPHIITTPASIADMLSNNKARNEITITPVGQFDLPAKEKGEVEEAEDSADRLVIDESEADGRNRGDNSSDGGDEVPQCQGCNQKPAQFVCAGCGNQWYCSRECQVVAWDEHSEVCSG